MNKIVISMGDPAGIGPEIIVKYFEEYLKKEYKTTKLVVSGNCEILKTYRDKFGYKFEIKELTTTELTDSNIDNSILNVINTSGEKITAGEISKEAGELSMAYLEKATTLVQDNIADGLVTAPISKESINLAGYNYSGHTEFLAEKTGTEDFGMVLKGNKITVVLNTTHLSMEEAIKKVKKESILKKIILADRAKKELGIKTKIAVAGLNPHNGENGLFGNEEGKEIIPAVEEAKKLGIDVEGPIVPDTLFVKMLQNKYNIAVVMYHDQGLIPMKMESFGMGVNITVGLPIVRTSVDHGTAFDIAGKGIADCGSLRAAIETADMIINNKKKDR